MKAGCGGDHACKYGTKVSPDGLHESILAMRDIFVFLKSTIFSTYTVQYRGTNRPLESYPKSLHIGKAIRRTRPYSRCASAPVELLLELSSQWRGWAVSKMIQTGVRCATRL